MLLKNFQQPQIGNDLVPIRKFWGRFNDEDMRSKVYTMINKYKAYYNYYVNFHTTRDSSNSRVSFFSRRKLNGNYSDLFLEF